MAQEGPIASGVIPAGTVTLAQMADLAVDKVIGRATAGTGVPEAIACTAAGRAMIAAATGAAQLALTGGVDAATVAAGYQPLDSDLTAIAALNTNGLVKRTGTGTASIIIMGTGSGQVATTDQNDLRFAAISHTHGSSEITGLTHRYQLPATWYRVNLAINQTASPLVRAGADASFANTVKMPRAGSIVGMAVRLTAAVTAGSLGATVTLNGAAGNLGVTCTAGSNPSGGVATQAAGSDVYSAGDAIGVNLDSDAIMLPAATNDIEVWVQIEEVA